ncbi:MAG: hypothetical protein AAF597_01585 [Bacteroidota bacterium]
MQFIRLILLFLPVFVLTSCEGNTAARKAARGPDYVPAPNRLYFKNTRIRHYAADERRQEVTVYRHDDLHASAATLLPLILDYWLEDRANIRFEVRPKPNAAPLPKPFRLDLQQQKNWKTLRLTTPPTKEELTQLRDHLATQQDLRLVMGLDTLNPFPDEARAAAKEVLDDYLRLVD